LEFLEIAGKARRTVEHFNTVECRAGGAARMPGLDLLVEYGLKEHDAVHEADRPLDIALPRGAKKGDERLTTEKAIDSAGRSSTGRVITQGEADLARETSNALCIINEFGASGHVIVVELG
jgi:hypothetical protein